jgi:hypothetical protein
VGCLLAWLGVAACNDGLRQVKELGRCKAVDGGTLGLPGVAWGDRRVEVGSQVDLEAGSHTLGDGGPCETDGFTVQWNLTSAPPGSTAHLVDAQAVRTSFVADRPGTYGISLTRTLSALVDSHSMVVTASQVAREIAGNAVAAVADPDGTRVLVATADPEVLLFLGSDGNAGPAVALPVRPVAMRWRPGSRQVVVAHASMLSVVDVDSHQVVDTWPTGAEVADLEVTSSGTAILWPSTGAWTRLRTVHVDTGAQATLGGDVRAGGRFVLHPSGTRLYGVELGAQPSLIRLDLEANAVTPTRTPFAAMALGPTVVMLGDAQVLAGRTLVRVQEQVMGDMHYVTSLEDAGEVTHAAYSAPTQELVACGPLASNPALDEVRTFSDTFLQTTSHHPLPILRVGGQPVDAHSRFAFPVGVPGGTAFLVVVGDGATAPPFVSGWAVLPHL